MPQRSLPSASLTNLQILRRMIGWGLWMAFRWGWFPFACGGGLGMIAFWFPDNHPAPPMTQQQIEADDGPGNAIFLGILYLALWVTCLWAAGGAITGSVVGYCAPAESKKPWKSKLFSEVGRFTFWSWFWSTVLSVIFLLSYLFSYRTLNDYFSRIILSIIAILFLLSLIIGLNRGLRKLAFNSELDQ